MSGFCPIDKTTAFRHTKHHGLIRIKIISKKLRYNFFLTLVDNVNNFNLKNHQALNLIFPSITDRQSIYF